MAPELQPALPDSSSNARLRSRSAGFVGSEPRWRWFVVKTVSRSTLNHGGRSVDQRADWFKVRRWAAVKARLKSTGERRTG